MQEKQADRMQAEETDEVLELQCNLDDMPPEELSYAMDVLLKAGALDVYTIPIGMKKSRTGILLSVLCRQEHRQKMAQLIFQNTTTIGIREYVCSRMVLRRQEEVVETIYGPVRVKKSAGYGVEKEKYEYEDLREIADRTGCSIGEIRKELHAQYNKK